MDETAERRFMHIGIELAASRDEEKPIIVAM